MPSLKLLNKSYFAPLFYTQFLGAFNDNFLKNALVIIVTMQSITVFGFPAAQTVAISGGVFILPFFLFSAMAGQISDHYDKSSVLGATKILEIIIMLASAAALLGKNYEFLLITLFLMGLQSTFFGPAKFSILPQHLKPEELVAGNALIEAGTFLAILMGTILGGLLITLSYGTWIVSMALILIAVVGYLTSRHIPAAPAYTPHSKIQLNPFSTTYRMFRLAKANPQVFKYILAASWFWFMGAMILSIFPPLCKDFLGSDEYLITLFLAIFSVGIGTGSVACNRLSLNKIEPGLVPLGGVGMTLFIFFLYLELRFFTGLPNEVYTFMTCIPGIVVLITLFLLSFFSGLYIVPLNALMQDRSEPKIRSQMIAANNISNSFYMVVASILLLIMLEMNWPVIAPLLFLAIANTIYLFAIFQTEKEFLQRFRLWLSRRQASGHNDIKN